MDLEQQKLAQAAATAAQADVTAARANIEAVSQSITNLDQQEISLKAEDERLQTRIANVPVESLAAVEQGCRRGEPTTGDLLRLSEDVRLKLSLFHGIRVRLLAQLEGHRRKLRQAIRTLTRIYAVLAEQKALAAEAEDAQHLLSRFGGNLELAQSAAARVHRGGGVLDLVGAGMPESDSRRWVVAFAHFSHGADPVTDAAVVCGMAAAFDRGESPD